MIVIPPLTITDQILVSSNIEEVDTYDSSATEWVSGAGYSIDSYVYRTTTHKLYKCITTIVAASAQSTILPEVSVYGTSSPWVEDRPTNKWAMFDYTRNTKTISDTGLIQIVLNPVQRIDAIGLTGLEGVDHIEINAVYNGGTTASVVNSSVSSTSLLQLDIPPFYNVTVTVSLSGAGTVKCGGCIIGIYKNLGHLQQGVDVDATNFSSVTRDTYGNTSMTQRRTVPKISLTTFVDPTKVNSLSILRDKLNAVPALWSGMDTDITDNYYESLLIVGFYKTFKFSLDNQIGAYLDLELEEI